jgi:hypothetical protein
MLQSGQAPFHQALYITTYWQGSYRTVSRVTMAETSFRFAPRTHKFTQLKTSRLVKDNRKKLPHWMHTNSRRHRTIFTRPGNVQPWFTASLANGGVKSLRKRFQARFERTFPHFRHFLGIGLSRELRGQTSSWFHKIMWVVYLQYSVLLGNFVVPRPVKKFPEFYATQGFFTEFTRSRH